MANRNVKIVVTDGGNEVQETVINTGFGTLATPYSGTISQYRSSKDVVVLRAIMPNNSVTFPSTDLSFNWYYLDYKCNDASFANAIPNPSGDLLDLPNQTVAKDLWSATDGSWSQYKWTYTDDGNCGGGFYAVQNDYSFVNRYYKVEVFRKISDFSWNYFDTFLDFDPENVDTSFNDYRKSTGVAAVLFDTIKLKLFGADGLVLQPDGTYKRNLAADKMCLDTSHSCLASGYNATYIWFKNCIPQKPSVVSGGKWCATSPSILADGEYYVHSLINYPLECECFETKSNTIIISGEIGKPGDSSGSPIEGIERCEDLVRLCAVNTGTSPSTGDNNANLNLANGPVSLYISYPSPVASDTLQVFLVEQSITGSDVYIPVDVSGLAWNRRTFEVFTGGCYTVVLTRPSLTDPSCTPQVCTGSILVENGKDCDNFCLKFTGATDSPTINVDTTTHEDDNEHDQLMSYYCVTTNDLCDLVDISYNNVYLQKMVWNTTSNKWDCSTNDIDGSQYLTSDNSGAYSGWVLYKIDDNRVPIDCISSGSFDSSDSVTGTIVLNFEKLLGLTDVVCDPEEIFKNKYQMCIYTSNGCVCATHNFKFVQKIESVNVSCPDTLLECGKSITLTAEVKPTGTAVKYQWMLNGKNLTDSTKANSRYTQPTLKLEFTDEVGVYQVKVTTIGEKTELCDVYACKGTTLLSNSVVVLKKLGVTIENLQANVEVDKNGKPLVDITKQITLRANVLGAGANECIKYQWFVLDCDGSYVLEKVSKGANDGSDIYVRCPIGDEETLVLDVSLNYFINKQIEVTATVLTNGYKPLLTNTSSVPTFLVNGITCVKREKVITVRDTIKTTQNICIELTNTDSAKSNLLCFPCVDVKLNFCNGFDFKPFDVSYNHQFNQGTASISGGVLGTGGVESWKIEYLSDTSYNTLQSEYVSDCPGKCEPWWTKGTGKNVSSAVDQSHNAIGNIFYRFCRTSSQLKEGWYKLFIALRTEQFNYKSLKGETQSNYYDDCNTETCAIYYLTRSFKPVLESCEEGAGMAGVTEYICGDCSSNETLLDNSIPFHLDLTKTDNQECSSLPPCFSSATVRWTYTDNLYDISGGLACNSNNGTGELILGYSQVSCSQTGVTVNFKKLFEDASRCVFWNCENIGTLKAYIAYWDASTNLLDGTLADISNIRTVCQPAGTTTQVYVPKTENGWEMISYNKLVQKLGVSINADPKSPGREDILNADNVNFDPSGICFTVNVCGVPKQEKEKNQQLIDNYDVNYHWFKKNSFGVWEELAAPTTFNKIVLRTAAQYKVVVSRLIGYWDSSRNVEWCGGSTLLGNMENQCAKNEHILALTLTGEQYVTINPPLLLITNVAVRPTSRNVLSLTSDAVVVNSTSNIGRLRAYVLPEDSSYTYQWYKNGVPVRGANESSYLPKLNDAVSGDYTVRVTSHHNSVLSKPYNIVYQN